MYRKRKPGVVRDAIVGYMERIKRDVTVAEVRAAVKETLGEDVPDSSVRSYLGGNTPRVFIRTGRGRYRLVSR